LISCNSGPKVIESDSEAANSESANYSVNDAATIPSLAEASGSSNTSSDQHKVVVDEVLNTERYTYLNVSENETKYWIAISKREVKVGDTYYFKGGLLKKNFFSQEYNRVFETMYLVSNFWKQPSSDEAALDQTFAELRMKEGQTDLEVGNIAPAEGAITLAELFKNKEQYANQLIKVTGKCVKVNPRIMNRNWVHIQDSSDEELDLTITTAENIPLGAVVTLEGTIALNKDFGAGYRYDIIMEGAVVQ
jgi:hypothetical protein